MLDPLAQMSRFLSGFLARVPKCPKITFSRLGTRAGSNWLKWVEIAVFPSANLLAMGQFAEFARSRPEDGRCATGSFWNAQVFGNTASAQSEADALV